jgi:hypothetical protein
LLNSSSPNCCYVFFFFNFDIDFELYPTGSGTGEKYYSGGGLVTSKELTASFDGMVEATFTLQGTGALTETTV